MEHREHEEDVDNPPVPAAPLVPAAPVVPAAPAPIPAPIAQALPQLPQGLPYYGAPFYHQAAQMVQPAPAIQQAAQVPLMQQAAQVPVMQQAAQALPQLHHAMAYGGPASPQHPAMNVGGPPSPLVHLQPQHPSPARGGNRAPSSGNVTLPWEKRNFCGRPNATDNMLKKLYEEGRIAPPHPPPHQANAFHWQLGHFYQPPPLPYAQPVAPAFFNAAAPMPGPAAPMPGPAAPMPGPAAPMPGPAAPVPGPAAPAPVLAAAAASAPVPGAAGASGPVPSGSSTGSRPECRFCRSDSPDGFLRCGHALCRSCYARIKVNSNVCPDPRCNGSLDDESFTPMKL